MKTSWERTKGDETFYASIGPKGLTIGSHRGSGHTDSCGTYDLAEFLDGGFCSREFKAAFGDPALQEARAAAEHQLELLGLP